jgi:hypothetical protein
VVTSLEGEESRLIYEGMYTVEGYGEGYFFPIWVTAYSTDWSTTFLLGYQQLLIYDMYFAFCFYKSWMVVCVLVMQKPSVLLDSVE